MPDLDPLVAFLRDRLDEREVEYRQGVKLYDFDGNGDEAWIEEESKRGLADVAAKRRIIAKYEDLCRPEGLFERLTFPMVRTFGEDALKLLALPFAGHSEYREEWRP